MTNFKTPATAPKYSLLSMALAAAMIATPAFAQTTAPTKDEPTTTTTPEAKKPTNVGTVQVRGASDLDERKNESVSKIIINREDFLKQGDTSIMDVLKRLPGISTGGRGGGPRMRGLGGGYTQILVDGSPQGAGFQLAQIAPDMIERIEIVPSATAEYSTRAVAGTINIVLRKNVSRSQRKLTGMIGRGGHREMEGANITFSNSMPKFGYNVMLGVNNMDSQSKSRSTEQRYDANDNLVGFRNINSVNEGDNVSLHSMTRLNWQLGNGDSLAFQMMAFGGNNKGNSQSWDIATLGQQAMLANGLTNSTSKSRSARPSLEWTHPFGEAGTFTLRGGMDFDKSDSSTHYIGNDINGNQRVVRDWYSDSRGNDYKINGKVENTFAQKHKVTAGWEVENSKDTASRLQYDTFTGQPTTTFVDDNTVKIKRASMFVQDEFRVNKRLSTYLGARWEGSETKVEGLTFDPVKNKTSVFSPIASMLYRLSDTERDQIRVGLARTYNQPGSRQLIPRSYSSVDDDNSPTNPVGSGNPNLKPEISLGLDVAYENYFAKTGFFGISGYYRHIDDAISNQISFVDGLWISRPENAGKAKAWGISAEAKFPLRAFLPNGPDMDIRSNIARNWSTVDYWPSPYNVLASQTPVTGNLGFDWRATPKLTVGSDVSYNRGRISRTSLDSTQQTWSVWNMDAFATYKFSPKFLIRFSANNLLPKDERTQTLYDLASGGWMQRDNWSSNYRSYRLMAEYKF